MIPLFELTSDQNAELNEKLKKLGPFDALNLGPHLGAILRFHEDIHINLLMGEEVRE